MNNKPSTLHPSQHASAPKNFLGIAVNYAAYLLRFPHEQPIAFAGSVLMGVATGWLLFKVFF